MRGYYNLVTFLCSHGAGVDVTDIDVSSVCVCVHDVIDIVILFNNYFIYEIIVEILSYVNDDDISIIN